MRQKATVFEQVVQQFPWQHFDRLVREHGADNTQRGFTSRKHFLALLAGALGGQQGLRPTVAGLAPNSGALRPLGGKARHAPPWRTPTAHGQPISLST
jgi:hypothetical protein